MSEKDRPELVLESLFKEIDSTGLPTIIRGLINRFSKKDKDKKQCDNVNQNGVANNSNIGKW